MEQPLDVTPAPREEIGPVARLVRIALVVYLSPVILVVLAIGGVAMLASKLMKPAPALAADGPRMANQPMGLARSKKRARELA